VAPPPSRDELLALAERGLAHAGPDAQATARWTRELHAVETGAELAQGIVVEVAVVRGGRTGLLATADVDEQGLERAARGAVELAAGPDGGACLGAAAPGRAHDGYDPAVLALDAGTAAAAALAFSPDGGGAYRVTATKLAIASAAGVRAYEQRSSAEVRVARRAPGGRALSIAEAAVGPGGLDPERLAAEADALLGSGDPVDVPAGEYAVVLAPWAVAEVLRRAAPAFAGAAVRSGPLAGRFGTRVVAPNINLSDSPRYPGTLPRSYDAEGVPRQPVPLIQDGVAHRAVHDSTSAAAAGVESTGHARLPGGLAAPLPEHLVLVGGGAAGVEELAAPIAHGLLIGSITPGGIAQGVRLIRDGRIAEPVANRPVAFDALDVLARVQALTGRQRAVPPARRVPAASVGATLAPGLRASGGVHLG
jgi:predicted Zn-dependent protease